MNVPFFLVDVFADGPLEGNPLALVPQADSLTTKRMVAIAREFNQSETTFLVTPTVAGADRRLRSFTPGGVEVGGAGHNAMGAWIWLADRVLPEGRRDYLQQIGSDVLPVRIDRPASGGVQVTMLQSPPRFLGSVDRGRVLAGALGLRPDELGRAPEVVSTGVAHLLVELTGRGAVDRAAPDAQALSALLAASGAEGCLVYSTERSDDAADAYSRFFNPTVGIAEDPATGTAAGPLAALLVRDAELASGRIRVLQGAALGRPSTLHVRVDGPVVELSGSGLTVAEGTLRL